MNTEKIIIIGDLSNMMDKDLYYEYLCHIADILKWDKEMMFDMKLSAKIYEAPRNLPVSA